ncbi:hypothetical protein HDU83_002129 [Entophlyctis luteolus]|nr:hypothetical protein HDU83_002129 [Entophlyctis luteolus]
MATTPCARRLLHDLNELVASPVPYADARPVCDSDLSVWHGNLMFRHTTSSVTAPHPRMLHLKLVFSDTYPSTPPAVYLFSQLPHPNVIPDSTTGLWKICLDMLGTGVYANPNATTGGTFPYSGWSSSYTVKSIMMQIQAFLFDSNTLKAFGSGGIIPCLRHIDSFACQDCPHTPAEPFPSVSADLFRKEAMVYVPRPFVKDLLEIAAAKKNAVDVVNGAIKALDIADPDGWVLCGGKTPEGRTHNNELATAVKDSIASGTTFDVLMYLDDDDDAPPEEKMKVKATMQLSPPASPPKKPKVDSTSYDFSPNFTHDSKTLGSKSHLKNQKRKDKRARHRQTAANTDLETTSVFLSSSLETVNERESAKPEQDTQEVQSSHPFAKLPYEIVLQILSLLSVETITTLSQVSKFFFTATEDGYVWKYLYTSLDAKVEMEGVNVGDWKHVYRMQVNGVVQDLKCFHRKTTFREDVLGVPIEFTVNPVKQTVDYMHSTMDLLSFSAFKHDGVRKTVWGEKFTDWLPLYISYDHYQRALPHIKKSLRRLSPHIKSNGFDPICVIEVLPKLMNTQIVLLCDQGLHNSDSFLTNYFQIHRLFLSLVYEFPVLKRFILERINGFSKSNAGRHKNVVPSLGDLIPLLSVLPDPAKAWNAVGAIFLKESFERSVLWACRYNPDIAKLKPCPPHKSEPFRINDTFDATSTSLKLWATHVKIFHAITSYGTSSLLATTHDMFYGQPPAKFLKKLKDQVSRVLSAGSFEEIVPHFHLSGAKQLPFAYPKFDAAKLTICLRECVQRSAQKKYHSPNMDFSRIHASGVSKILRKGQSYRCAPNMTQVVMEESWAVGGDSTFLDASALVYGFQGEFLGYVDYCNQISQNGCIRHSGDIVVDGRGSHKITVDLKKLGDTVQSLVFTMSAWTGTLKTIKSPEVRLFDGTSMTELCQYSFDGCARAGHNTCVVMCRLRRERIGANWSVVALGTVGMGTARNYDEIRKTVGLTV